MSPTRAVTLLLLLGLSLPVSADVLTPYKAVYEVNRGNIMLGDTTFSLNKQGDDCYLLRNVVVPKGIAAMFAGEITESSHFCVENDRIRSQQYSIHEENGDKDDSYTLKFDWGNQLVRTNNGNTRELPTDGLDRSVMEIAMRRLLARAGDQLPTAPFVFLMVEDDEIKPYRFQITAREQVATRVGRFDTVKVERLNAGKRDFRLWLAPELDYLPVQVERQKKGSDAYRMTLRELPKSPASD